MSFSSEVLAIKDLTHQLEWVGYKLGNITESKEVAKDVITKVVLDQVSENAFGKCGKLFILMHLSNKHQHP